MVGSLQNIELGLGEPLKKMRCVQVTLPQSFAGLPQGSRVECALYPPCARQQAQSILDQTEHLTHPAVRKPLFHYETEQKGQSLLVLAYPARASETFADVLARTRHFLLPDLQRVCHAALEALQAAHKNDATHGRFHPKYITFSPDGHQVKLDGFYGVGASQEERSYYPPRAADSTLVDLYAVGALFFRCLAGRLPVFGDTECDADAAGPFLLRSLQKFDEPDQWSRLKSNIYLIPGLDAFLRRALSLDPAWRFHTAAEMAEHLLSLSNRCLPSEQGAIELGAFLGRGGFGEVYQGRLPNGRKVAVKRLLYTRAERRFLQEAKVMQLLAGARVVEYIDLVFPEVSGDGSYYLVMELLDGMPNALLRNRIRANPAGMPVPEVLELFATYLLGLEQMHRCSIVHRDIKPANLYAPAERPMDGKLFDLGIVYDHRASMTRGGVPGTWEYKAPEFAEAAFRGSPRSDLYSLGLCLYQALTGQSAFPPLRDQDGPEEIAWFERHQSASGPDLKRSLFRTFPELVPLIRKTVHANPQQRYSDARAMLYEIVAVLGKLTGGDFHHYLEEEHFTQDTKVLQEISHTFESDPTDWSTTHTHASLFANKKPIGAERIVSHRTRNFALAGFLGVVLLAAASSFKSGDDAPNNVVPNALSLAGSEVVAPEPSERDLAVAELRTLDELRTFPEQGPPSIEKALAHQQALQNIAGFSTSNDAAPLTATQSELLDRHQSELDHWLESLSFPAPPVLDHEKPAENAQALASAIKAYESFQPFLEPALSSFSPNPLPDFEAAREAARENHKELLLLQPFFTQSTSLLSDEESSIREFAAHLETAPVLAIEAYEEKVNELKNQLGEAILKRAESRIKELDDAFVPAKNFSDKADELEALLERVPDAQRYAAQSVQRDLVKLRVRQRAATGSDLVALDLKALGRAPLSSTRQLDAAAETGLPGAVRTLQSRIPMVLVPHGKGTAGSKALGSDVDEHPVLSLEAPASFFVSQTEITEAHWAVVMDGKEWTSPTSGLPKANIDSQQVQTFLERLCTLEQVPPGTYSLLSELEWEYAARAESKTVYHHGRSRLMPEEANYLSGQDRDGPVPVASYEPNAWGLYDVHGNLLEWVADSYVEDAYQAFPDAKATLPGINTNSVLRVIRGGSFRCKETECRLSFRDSLTPRESAPYLGFRIKRSISTY